MKPWLLILLLSFFYAPVIFGQNRSYNYNAIDNKAAYIETAPIPELTAALTAGYSTDLEKVRSIFRWITDHIEYRTGMIRPNRFSSKSNADNVDDTAALKPLDERVAESVLANGSGVCDGYARLFKTLCTYAGIRCEMISGYAKTESTRKIQRFRPNHSWNAVMIDSTWKLLDVTWASGYVTGPGDQFVRYFDEQYFLTDPSDFIREHYPEDLSWALMDDPPLLPEFRYSPYKQRCFMKYRISDYFPSTGIINCNVGDTVKLHLTSGDPFHDAHIMSDPFLDTSLYNHGKSAVLVVKKESQRIFYYDYIANDPQVQWLYILYNDDLVLRYRLSISNRGGVASIH